MQLHNWAMSLALCMQIIICLLLYGSLAWSIIQHRLALSDPVWLCLFQTLHLGSLPEFFLMILGFQADPSDAGPARADPCSDSWHFVLALFYLELGRANQLFKA